MLEMIKRDGESVMNKKTHLIFGKIIWNYLNENYGITLNRAGFLLGNVAPDLTFSFVIHPHEREVSSERLKERIKKAVRESDTEDFDAGFFLAERLGSICHYCADFFCEAHTKRYVGSIKEHVLYEKQLCDYCVQHRVLLEKELSQPTYFSVNSAEAIFKEIERLNDLYMQGEASFKAQAEGALSACFQTVGVIMVTRYYDHAFSTQPRWSI